MSIEEVSKKAVEAGIINDSVLSPLTADFFEHKTRKHIKSLNIETDFVIRKDSLDYKLIQPRYVHQIELSSADALNKKVAILYKLAGDSEFKESSPTKSGSIFIFPIHGYVSEIKISPESDFLSNFTSFGKYSISKISIFGADENNLVDAVDAIKSLRKTKKEIRDLAEAISINNQSQLNAIATESERLLAHHADLDVKIEEKSIALDELELDIEKKLSELQAKSDEIERKVNQDSGLFRDIESKKSHISSLESNIATLDARRAELIEAVRKLNENKSLFTDEISSYAEQGRNSIGVYLAIISIPSIVLAIMAAKLLGNAAILASIKDIASLEQAFSYLVARMPYAVVSITIIYACYGVISNIFDKIFFIHKSRLHLSSLSILAKDITESAQAGVDVTDSEIYAQRIKARMDLIKWHIQGMPDFEKTDAHVLTKEVDDTSVH